MDGSLQISTCIRLIVLMFARLPALVNLLSPIDTPLFKLIAITYLANFLCMELLNFLLCKDNMTYSRLPHAEERKPICNRIFDCVSRHHKLSPSPIMHDPDRIFLMDGQYFSLASNTRECGTSVLCGALFRRHPRQNKKLFLVARTCFVW
jgi:hypothetical protein